MSVVDNLLKIFFVKECVKIEAKLGNQTEDDNGDFNLKTFQLSLQGID